DGKFIGLDHEVPLGKNGITVAEYYGGGGNTGSSVLGDVNCDGAVDVRDITLLVKYILGSGSLSSSALKNADVSSDGKVNVSDVSYLKRQLISIK
ncbi:MAG TPA: endoglucanase, partial [Ruminococcus sp.]|nr:endoglucanase [Ruminococcus sp.]